MLAPYAPAGFDKLTATFSDKNRPPSWVGMDVFAAVVCYNTVEGPKKGIPKPTSWADLAKPVYKGQVTMPNPASSGTGYLSVSAWLQLMGEAGGWKYMDQLHENVAQYTHSGSKPCRQSGAGEFVVGISFDFRGNDVKQKGAPVELVFPEGRRGLGRGGLRHREGHEEDGCGEEAHGLGGHEGGQRGICEELRASWRTRM